MGLVGQDPTCLEKLDRMIMMQPERSAPWALLTRPIPSASNTFQPADLQKDGPLTWLPSDGTDLCFMNSWSTTPIFSEAGPCKGKCKGGLGGVSRRHVPPGTYMEGRGIPQKRLRQS
jgi:hypothetical protein